MPDLKRFTIYDDNLEGLLSEKETDFILRGVNASVFGKEIEANLSSDGWTVYASVLPNRLLYFQVYLAQYLVYLKKMGAKKIHILNLSNIARAYGRRGYFPSEGKELFTQLLKVLGLKDSDFVYHERDHIYREIEHDEQYDQFLNDLSLFGILPASPKEETESVDEISTTLLGVKTYADDCFFASRILAQRKEHVDLIVGSVDRIWTYHQALKVLDRLGNKIPMILPFGGLPKLYSKDYENFVYPSIDKVDDIKEIVMHSNIDHCGIKKMDKLFIHLNNAVNKLQNGTPVEPQNELEPVIDSKEYLAKALTEIMSALRTKIKMNDDIENLSIKSNLELHQLLQNEMKYNILISILNQEKTKIEYIEMYNQYVKIYGKIHKTTFNKTIHELETEGFIEYKKDEDLGKKFIIKKARNFQICIP